MIPKVIGVEIIGSGSALPSRVVSNESFSEILETSNQWIFERTGIRERRFCDSHESSATLATEAARRALEDAKLVPRQIDLIICATVTPERMTPSNAAQVQAALGCNPCPAFDISSACSGFLFALGVARGMILGGEVRYALVIGAEALSRALDFTDRNSCILFGDGAGAVVLASTDHPDRGIRYFAMATDGKKGDLIQVPGIAPGRNSLATPAAINPTFIMVEGPETFRFAVKTMARLLTELHANCGLEWSEVGVIIPHQVNKRVFETVAAQLGIPLDKFFINIHRYGNTAAASIPIALDEAFSTNSINFCKPIILVAFGGGLSWSVAIIDP